MDKKQKQLLLALCYTVLFSVMNGTMFNVALPEIARDFGLLPSQVSWVVVGYGMVFAIGSITYGKLADLFPVRRLVTIGLSIFSLGSVLGFFASAYWLVIMARIVQASGAAAIPALGMIVATKYFPAERRGYVLGYIASTVAFGTGIGPMLGGMITQWFGWSVLFLFSVTSLLALPILHRALPVEQMTKGSFDTMGALLFGAGIASLLLGINANLMIAGLAVVFFVLFGMHIRRTQAPFIQVSLLANGPYRLLLLLGMMIFFAMMSSFFILPLLLEEVNGLKAGVIGLVLFPGSMMAALLGSRIGRLSDKYGSAVIIKWASLSMALGFVALSTFIGISPVGIACMLVVVYLGFSSIQSALASFVSRPLERKEIGVGMGLYNLTTFMGSAFGPALVSRFLEMHTGHWNLLNGTAFDSYSNAYLILAVVCLGALVVLALVQIRLSKEAQLPAQQYESI
ncbi:MFS transporter [Aneurinibacillus migulanus]|uniref:MFS transporter, DHA2 family, metal-tetracycline-proton antiporter n=1 Tax=Aneurinibacillus migulanus TaxID=47500 RepID=A0A1G8TZ04_ANEMI|nr:MFS transporter [Aneurinibacillus migulanus]MCP1358256.1 MFS transporter [Aneurinibacillus migulanus]MED0893519.1 MFS transporter [Aneurinibacillus migulanus]MED1616379.1 MFS transporter [Aneurinibacillus migulanus]MED4729947.1 MFS transporter [Aneurinibacillus migulanus]SDJ46614.1 MFS transporter, DHA2 family, metal-tetracycline-proton antiporter [Aneurinibacillus migulanus]